MVQADHPIEALHLIVSHRASLDVYTESNELGVSNLHSSLCHLHPRYRLTSRRLSEHKSVIFIILLSNKFCVLLLLRLSCTRVSFLSTFAILLCCECFFGFFEQVCKLLVSTFLLEPIRKVRRICQIIVFVFARPQGLQRNAIATNLEIDKMSEEVSLAQKVRETLDRVGGLDRCSMSVILGIVVRFIRIKGPPSWSARFLCVFQGCSSARVFVPAERSRKVRFITMKRTQVNCTAFSVWSRLVVGQNLNPPSLRFSEPP